MKDNILICQHDVNLIPLANDLAGDTTPVSVALRRIFSLARNIRFETVVIERFLWPDDPACDENICGVRRASCEQYIYILNNYYNYCLQEKVCYKIAFFNSSFTQKEEIKTKINKDLVAFCIVHKDTLEHVDGTFRERLYVTESYIDIPDDRMKIFTIAKSSTETNIAKKPFQISGNYFAQQNGLTNCCAHAAIKMAIRGFYPHVTAEEINREAGINHKCDNKGNKGFEPHVFVDVIKRLSRQSACHIEARSLETPLQFLKLVYHAIESRFPVILLFTYPTKHGHPQKLGCHAATLIGHTFNKHTWWGYAQKTYFSFAGPELNYLPSFVWCDSLVIQDDNLGPYYLLPLRSLKISDLSDAIPLRLRGYLQNIKFRLSRKSQKFQYLYSPLSAIITYPKALPHFEDVIKVEALANKKLIDYVHHLHVRNLKPKNNVYFSDYFLPSFKQECLVLRTFALRREEYLQSFSKNYLFDHQEKYLEALRTLPEFIWVTEISVPELFWINHQKLGEIITNPTVFSKNPKEPVKVIRLPGILSFFEDHHWFEYYTNEHNSKHDLISPKCNECFV